MNLLFKLSYLSSTFLCGRGGEPCNGLASSPGGEAIVQSMLRAKETGISQGLHQALEVGEFPVC